MRLRALHSDQQALGKEGGREGGKVGARIVAGLQLVGILKKLVLRAMKNSTMT